MTPTRIRVEFNVNKIEKSKDNIDRYVVLIDKKPLEIINKEIEYYVEYTGNIVEDICRSLHRLDGAKGIERISVGQ